MGRLSRRNHKSAEQHGEFLAKALTKGVEKGLLLPDMEISPLGVAVHSGFSADGSYISKERVTHDL